MRYWNKKVDPSAPPVRKRSVLRPVSSFSTSSFNLKPLFGKPGDEEGGPVDSALPPESRLDDIIPTDNSPGNSGEASPASAIVTINTFRVFASESPPTIEDLDEAFGTNNKVKGFIGVLHRSTGVNYIVTSNGTDWFYHLMNLAVAAE